MIYKVYTLQDPITLDIRYVGITKDTLASRLSKHLYETRKLNKRNHKVHWLRTLTNKNLRPIIEELEDAYSYEELQKLEVYWIAQFKNWGFNLVNTTSGGEGCIGYTHSAETREFMKQRMLETKKPKKVQKIKATKEQHKKNISEALSIPITEYYPSGEIKKHWKSCLKASKFYEVRDSAIGHALRKPDCMSVGSFWRYTSDNITKILISPKAGNKSRIKVEYLNGNTVLCETLDEARKELGVCFPTIVKYIKQNKLFNGVCYLKKY